MYSVRATPKGAEARLRCDVKMSGSHNVIQIGVWSLEGVWKSYNA